METVKLAVETREVPTKRATKDLRARGRVPGVVYGRGASIPVSFDAVEMRQALTHGRHVVIELHYPEEARGTIHLAVFKEMQRHPVGGALVHVDLQEVKTGEEIDSSVSLEITGVSPGVEAGGLLDQVIHEVVCHGEPANLPSSIMVDVSGLQVGHHILLGHLAVPKGCVIMGDPDQVLVTVLAPRTAGTTEVTEEEAQTAESQA
jgi:large subunit ribosomal protein L25